MNLDHYVFSGRPDIAEVREVLRECNGRRVEVTKYIDAPATSSWLSHCSEGSRGIIIEKNDGSFLLKSYEYNKPITFRHLDRAIAVMKPCDPWGEPLDQGEYALIRLRLVP